jgi:CheY-like chemotaxis protein
LSLSYSVDNNVPELVIGDQERLRQALLSLADNAVKFTVQGSVQIRVQWEALDQEKTVLRFSVQDTGIGIKPEYMDHIFRPFSQADTSGTRRHGGIGLGLTVAKSLVEMMGGQMWCESQFQRGSTFFFTAAFKLPKIEPESVVFPGTFQDLPILLVEDNKINQIVATKMLQKKGLHVEVAQNGLQAVEMVKHNQYALVLMDIQMPEMDGIQATLEIRNDSRYESLPIVALTANAMEDDRRQCLAAGMNDHLAKPIDPVLLYQAILKWAKTSPDAGGGM